MRKCGISIAFFLVTLCVGAQHLTLSPQAEISVITCGRGSDELYTAFGHSAIRVVDPVNRIDYAYNYGVFDFDQPNFYLNYTKGLLLFKLGVYAYPDFVNSYVYYNRWVTEQVLNLSPGQKQKVFEFLEWNALPENETYRYDYFYNNCANKVRDVFAQILGDSIHFDDSYITTSYTIRQLTDLYLTDQPWGDLGIDICLGLPMDKKASPYEYMFLPDYILSSFDHATISHGGAPQPMVKAKVPVFVNLPREPVKAPVHPWVVMGAFALVAFSLSLWDWRRKKLTVWFDGVLFFATGAVGVLLLLLWTATDHQAASGNMNLLWALPSNLIILAAFSKRARPKVRKYFLLVSIVSLLLLLTWSFLPQQLNNYLLPVVAAIAVRSYSLSRLMPD